MIMLINAQIKIVMQRSPKTRLEAEYPVKGSELLPRDSTRKEFEVRIAILLYEYFIDNMNMK